MLVTSLLNKKLSLINVINKKFKWNIGKALNYLETALGQNR